MTITQHGREQKQLNKLYEDFDAMGLIPLWTIRDNLMPMSPHPQALPHLWRWADLLPLAERSGELVPVGQGCARRAIALSNPGLPGLPYATPNSLGGDPLPRPPRGGFRPPAQSERVPLRHRG